MDSPKELENLCTQIRRDILRMVHAVQSGHPGGSLGCVEYFVALYFKVLKHKTSFQMNGAEEDLFFLSQGHISPVWYSTLARAGYFDLDELNTFRKLNSRLQGHPATEEGLPGVRIASGSLGQGLSVACGAAQAKKLNQDNHLVFSLHGDGELQEGQIWEAVMYAAAHQIDNLISTIDYNGRQIDGDLKDVLDLGDLEAKFKAFGWRTLVIEKGNDLLSVIQGLEKAKTMAFQKQPVAILLHTEMGNGVDFMMGTHKWHGSAPNDEQLQIGLSQNKETLGDY